MVLTFFTYNFHMPQRRMFKYFIDNYSYMIFAIVNILFSIVFYPFLYFSIVESYALKTNRYLPMKYETDLIQQLKIILIQMCFHIF